MAFSRTGYPTPPTDDDPDHGRCPVCGCYPCVDCCRVGLTVYELEELEALYFEPPASWDGIVPDDWEPGS